MSWLFHLISEAELIVQKVFIWDEKSAFPVSYTGGHFPMTDGKGGLPYLFLFQGLVPPFLLDTDGLFSGP